MSGCILVNAGSFSLYLFPSLKNLSNQVLYSSSPYLYPNFVANDSSTYFLAGLNITFYLFDDNNSLYFAI